MRFNHLIIEGIDRLGKDTLIQKIKDAFGYHLMVHYQKPEKLANYAECDNPLQRYQRASFYEGFQLLKTSIPTIYNRFHLGEYVYSPRYRNYSGEYVFEMEEQYAPFAEEDTLLILLTTSDFSFIQDDGESFDFSKKEEEQRDFKIAFDKSKFKYKICIDVSENGFYKPAETIFNEIFNRSALPADYPIHASVPFIRKNSTNFPEIMEALEKIGRGELRPFAPRWPGDNGTGDSRPPESWGEYKEFDIEAFTAALTKAKEEGKL